MAERSFNDTWFTYVSISLKPAGLFGTVHLGVTRVYRDRGRPHDTSRGDVLLFWCNHVMPASLALCYLDVVDTHRCWFLR